MKLLRFCFVLKLTMFFVGIKVLFLTITTTCCSSELASWHVFSEFVSAISHSSIHDMNHYRVSECHLRPVSAGVSTQVSRHQKDHASQEGSFSCYLFSVKSQPPCNIPQLKRPSKNTSPDWKGGEGRKGHTALPDGGATSGELTMVWRRRMACGLIFHSVNSSLCNVFCILKLFYFFLFYPHLIAALQLQQLHICRVFVIPLQPMPLVQLYLLYQKVYVNQSRHNAFQ